MPSNDATSPEPALPDPSETRDRIASPAPGLRTLLHSLRPPRRQVAPAVLYVHGATFPSALSVAHRFGPGPSGRSWRDALCAAGFEVWGLDFLGYGGSDRWPAMAGPAGAAPAPGAVEDAAAQLVLALEHIRAVRGGGPVSVLAHSWGTMPACRAAGDRPELVDRLALFGAIAPRAAAGQTPSASFPAWREVTVEQQRARFVADVPPGEPAVLDAEAFADWGERYLDSDPGSRSRRPPAVRIPAGPAADIARAWRGEWCYDPARVRAPVAVLRGEWDSLTTDADAATLLAAMTAAPERRDVRLARGTHLMHLETGRAALHAASIAFLMGQAASSSTR